MKGLAAPSDIRPLTAIPFIPKLFGMRVGFPRVGARVRTRLNGTVDSTSRDDGAEDRSDRELGRVTCDSGWAGREVVVRSRWDADVRDGGACDEMRVGESTSIVY